MAFYEEVAVVGTVDPGTLSATSYSTDTIDMDVYRAVTFVVLTGTLGSSGTVDFKVQQSTNGTAWSDMTGKAITQLTKAGGDDNVQAIVHVDASELGAGYRYVKGVLTVGTASSGAGVIALASGLRFTPASAYDLTSVKEIVT